MKELKASEPLLLDGVLTPDAILKDPTLSAGARLLWVLLAEHQGKVPECYPSQEMLAVPLGVKVRQLQSFIKELESYTRGDPPEPFPLVEVKLVFVEKDRKTRNIYNLLRWPLRAVDLKANGAERSHLADGGDAQYSAHRSAGEEQDAAAAPPAMPSEDSGAVASGMPPSDTQSFAYPRGDAQDTAALPEMLGKDAGLAPHGMPPGDTQYSAHRSGSDRQDIWTAPSATPDKDGGVTPDSMRDTQSAAHQSEGAPAALPSLVEEFQSWVGAESPPARLAPPSELTEDQERRLMVEYAKFHEAETIRLFDAIPALVLRRLTDKKQNLLRQEGRLDRMALDVRRREVKNLILLDIEREQVMPFAEWVEPKRKSGTST
jgi:hypothetical protein